VRFLKKNFFRMLGAGFLAAILLLIVAFQVLLRDLPRLDTMADYRPFLVSRLYDTSGELIDEYFIEKRTLIAIESLPMHVLHAFLAAEDSDFYEHKGLDYVGIMRAVATEFRYRLLGGKKRIGGSTITQQTAKTILLSSKRTYSRKLREMVLARRIESKFSKDEILNLYLNQIYFGNGAYGIEEAARIYYGKPARELSVGQAATLAGIPKSPNRINPIANPTRAKGRRGYVLQQMVENNFLAEEDAKFAALEEIRANVSKPPYLKRAPYYAEAVRQEVLAKLGHDGLFRSGLSIYSSINIHHQLSAQKSSQERLARSRQTPWISRATA